MFLFIEFLCALQLAHDPLIHLKLMSSIIKGQINKMFFINNVPRILTFLKENVFNV